MDNVESWLLWNCLGFKTVAKDSWDGAQVVYRVPNISPASGPGPGPLLPGQGGTLKDPYE